MILSTTLKYIYNKFVGYDKERSCEDYEKLKASLPEGYSDDAPVSFDHIRKEWGLRSAIFILGYLNKEYSEQLSKKLEEMAIYSSFKLNRFLPGIEKRFNNLNEKASAVYYASVEVSKTEHASRAAYELGNVRCRYDEYFKEIEEFKAFINSLANFLNAQINTNDLLEPSFYEIVGKVGEYCPSNEELAALLRSKQ